MLVVFMFISFQIFESSALTFRAYLFCPGNSKKISKLFSLAKHFSETLVSRGLLCHHKNQPNAKNVCKVVKLNTPVYCLVSQMRSDRAVPRGESFPRPRGQGRVRTSALTVVQHVRHGKFQGEATPEYIFGCRCRIFFEALPVVVSVVPHDRITCTCC